MKKTLMLFAAILMITGLYAQSVQWHQSYDNNQKFVADFFWSNDKFNVYSYNEFTVSKNQAEVRPSMKSITDGEKPVEVTYTEVSEEKVPIKIKGKYF